MAFEITNVGEFATIQGGYAYKTQDFVSEGVPVLKIKNVRKGFIEYSTDSFVSEQVAKSTARWFTRPKDVLISMTGSGPSAPESLVGRVGRVWSEEPQALINQRVGRLVVKPDAAISSDFLFYVLSQKSAQDFLVSQSTGSANQVNISGKTIESVPCPRVGLADSLLIANFLDLFETQIRSLQEINVVLQEISRSIFNAWFVSFEPVQSKFNQIAPIGLSEAAALFFPNSFEETDLGRIPAGWQFSTLEKISQNIVSRIKSQSEWANLDLLDLSRMPQKNLYPTKFGKGEELTTSVVEFSEGDTLFGAVRPYFHKVCQATRSGVTNTSVLVIRSSNNAPNFISHLASSNECVSHAVRFSEGTKMPTINWKNLSRHAFPCPPVELQIYFSDLVEPFFQKASNNARRIEALAELREMLLPDLISGHLRLRDVEVEINAI